LAEDFLDPDRSPSAPGKIICQDLESSRVVVFGDEREYVGAFSRGRYSGFDPFFVLLTRWSLLR